MRIGPKTIIAMFLFLSILIGGILVVILKVDFFAVGFIFAFAYLVFSWMFNWFVLTMYKDIWNLHWHKADGFGWIGKKWRDGYFSLRVLPLPKDNKVWFDFSEIDLNNKQVKKKEVCFVPFIEHDANSKAGFIMAKQGVLESVNLSATNFCSKCGYVPYDADHSTQLVTDELHERELVGKLSMLGKVFGEEKQGFGNMIWVIVIILLVVALILIWQNQDAITALTTAINELAKKIGTNTGTVVVTPGT